VGRTLRWTVKRPVQLFPGQGSHGHSATVSGSDLRWVCCGVVPTWLGLWPYSALPRVREAPSSEQVLDLPRSPLFIADWSLSPLWGALGERWGLVRTLGGREPHAALQAGGIPWGGRESFSAPLYISWSNLRGTTLPNVLNCYLVAGVISGVPLCLTF